MSNFIADNLDWLVPIGMILLTTLFGKLKKSQAKSHAGAKATQPQPQASSQPTPLPQILWQLKHRQTVAAQQPQPSPQPAAQAPTILPDEGISAVATRPITNHTVASAQAVRPAVSHQTLRRAIIWSQILHRPQF